jgi:hypothetical protein
LKREKNQIEENNEELKNNFCLLEKRLKDQRDLAVDVYERYERMKKENEKLKQILDDKDNHIQQQMFINLEQQYTIKSLETLLYNINGPNHIY